MKGLVKVIPMFVALIVLSFLGTLFVLANRDTVVINFGTTHTPPMALGLVVLTSCLAGMIASGLLCSVEVLVLMMQNKRLKKRLAAGKNLAKLERPLIDDPLVAPLEPADRDESKSPEALRSSGTGRFTPL